MFGQSFTPARGRGARATAVRASPRFSTAWWPSRSRLQRRPAVRRTRSIPLPSGPAAHDRVRRSSRARTARVVILRPHATCRRPGARRPPSWPRCWQRISSTRRRRTGCCRRARIRAAACETLADAGERALSLALGAEAQRAFDLAADLAEDDLARADLLDRAGRQPSRTPTRWRAGAPGKSGQPVRGVGDSSRGAIPGCACAEPVPAGPARRGHRSDAPGGRRLAEGSADQAEALASLSHFLMFKNEFDEALPRPTPRWRSPSRCRIGQRGAGVQHDSHLRCRSGRSRRRWPSASER